MALEENLRLIDRLYKAINDKSWDTVFGLHSEDHSRFDKNRPEPMKGLCPNREYVIGFADARARTWRYLDHLEFLTQLDLLPKG